MKSLLPFTYITSTLAFPRVSWRKHLLASRTLSSLHAPPPVLSSLHRCGFSVSTPKNRPHQQVFSVKQASGEGETQRAGTDQGAKLGLCLTWGLVLGAPPAGVTPHPRCTRCLITSLLIYHVWTYSCSSGLDSKQIAGGL